MGVDELKVIAAELVTAVRKSVTIDWTVRESARAKIRVMVRRILKKHGYPPISVRRPRGRCWNRQNCCARTGRGEPSTNGTSDPITEAKP